MLMGEQHKFVRFAVDRSKIKEAPKSKDLQRSNLEVIRACEDGLEFSYQI